MIPTPRTYQTAAIRAVYASIKSGRRRPLLVSPTGSGKSTIGALIVRDAVSRGRRVAWFAHRTELRDQAVETLARCEIDAGHSGAGASKPVQVVSVQGALVTEQVPEADVVVLDEAHHFAADEWGRLPAAYPNATIIGLTATPERADGRGLGHLFDDLHVVAQPRELVEQGHLVPCELMRPSSVQRPGFLASRPVDAYRLHASGRRNVVFAASVENACTFAAQFKMEGIDARIVHGDLASDVRARNLDDFASGRVRVLINVMVLTEGWDCPAVDVVTIARKIGSCSMWLQTCGRGLRPHAGKSQLLVMDLSGVSHIHGSPTDDRIFSLDGIGIRLAANAGPRFCRACGELLEEVGPCGKCGRSRRANVSDPKYSRDPLEKFAKYKTDTEAERCERLAKFIRQERERGNKWNRALFRYRGVYGVAPTHKITHVALLLARGPARGEQLRGW